MNNYESNHIIPNIELIKFTENDVANRLTIDELTLHNELVDELGTGPVPDDDPRWEHYNYLHNKALGFTEDKEKKVA